MTQITRSEDVQDATHRWAAAERSGDTTTLAALLADDFVGIGPHGFALNKEQWLARYDSGNLRNEAFDVEEITVRTYGATAIVGGVQVQQATYQGHPTNGPFRLTLVWVQDAQDWSIINAQLSSMPAR